VNSYEFIQAINRDIGSAKIMFDAAMALYQVIGQYNDLKIISEGSYNEAELSYIVKPGDPSKLNELLIALNGNVVQVYQHSYRVSAETYDGQNLILCMKPF
jgi:hypothetical protein